MLCVRCISIYYIECLCTHVVCNYNLIAILLYYVLHITWKAQVEVWFYVLLKKRLAVYIVYLKLYYWKCTLSKHLTVERLFHFVTFGMWLDVHNKKGMVSPYNAISRSQTSIWMTGHLALLQYKYTHVT